jgi:hypothetical protein
MHDAPSESIPQDVLAAFTSEERDAFFNHNQHFERLAAAATHPDIKRYLERIAHQDVFWVMLYSTDEAPFRTYFHHTVVEARESFRVRLPRPATVPSNLPSALRPIYQSLGGLHQEFGGLVCPEDIQTVAASGVWLSDDNSLDPNLCFFFYDFGDGDSLAYTATGDGVIYEHELGVLSPIDLEPFVSEAFQRLLPPPEDETTA